MADNDLDDVLDSLMKTYSKREGEEKISEDLPPRRTIILRDLNSNRTPGLALSLKDNAILSLYVLTNIGVRVKQSLMDIHTEPSVTFSSNSQMEIKVLHDAILEVIENMANKLVNEHGVEEMAIEDFKRTWNLK